MGNVLLINYQIEYIFIYIYLKLHKNTRIHTHIYIYIRKKGIFIQVFTILIEISQRVHEVH